MGADFAQASQTEIDCAKHGLTIQAEAFGLDLSDKNVSDFIDHFSKVMALDKATIRKLHTIVSDLSVKVNGLN